MAPVALASLALSMIGCERVPLLAPSGSTITLTASSTALSVNGTAQLIAQVIEPAGTPPHSGTHVIFTTSLGTIQPSETDTDINGRAVATFNAGSSNGTATITASSGGSVVAAANALKISVGTAAVGRVVVAANPTLIAANGGTAVISASVADINGNALAGAPVAFSTTAGTMNPSIATTDGNGNATSSLTTTTTATVTASVGAQGGSSTGGGGGTGGGGTGTGGGTTTPTTPAPSGQASGSVTVNVAAAPTLVIAPPTTPPSAGLPATFTFTVTVPTTNGSAIRDLSVNWGDGSPTQDLGVVSTTSTQTHVYGTAGSYTISAVLADTLGNQVKQTAGITVIPVPGAGIQITPSPIPGKVNTATTFSIQITLPTGIAVQSLSIDYGDGGHDDLGSTQSATQQHVYTTTGTFTVTVTVLDTLGRTTTGSTRVSIGI
ncbi:MAG TPA: Ig-like domain-containing protein [Vicinamibacterales bacterium]